MTPITQPQSVNYPSPLISRPALWRNPPQQNEGDRYVSCGITWGAANDGGPNNSVLVDFGQGAAQGTFSQLAALYVDNVNCDADVQFIMDNGQTRLTVPGGSTGLFPVFTQSLRVLVTAANALPGATTYFQGLNTLPPPVAVPKTDFTSTTTAFGVALTTGSTQIIAPGTNGILTGAVIQVGNVLAGAGAANDQLVLVDGSPKNLTGGSFGIQSAAFISNLTVVSVTGLNIPFTNGINLVQTFTGTALVSGAVSVTVTTR